MANQKDEDPHDSPTEAPNILPLKKRSVAERSLVGSNETLEPKSSISNSDDGDVVNSSETLQQLHRKAYYSVLLAFIAETSTISNKRNSIIVRLKKQWKIPQEIHISFVNEIKNNLQILQQRDEMELQIGRGKPLTTPVTSKSSFVPETRSSWGSVNPESLVGKCVHLRLEDEFDEFIIKAYDVELDMHRLVTPNSNAMEVDDAFSLFDLREFPAEDILWEGGQKPNFVVSKSRRASF